MDPATANEGGAGAPISQLQELGLRGGTRSRSPRLGKRQRPAPPPPHMELRLPGWRVPLVVWLLMTLHVCDEVLTIRMALRRGRGRRKERKLKAGH